MNDAFFNLLAAKSVLIADGAMGTSLFALGLEAGGSPELWNIEHPDRIASVHRGFIDAGADIVLSNSFGGNRHRLKLHGLEGRVHELNRAAVMIARDAAADAGRPIIVAGDIGPSGELFAPLGPLTPETGADAFAEQAAGLAAGGADIIWIETMSSSEEVAAAVAGAAATGLPVVCTMTFDTAGRTMMGLTPEAAAEFCQTLTPAPAAIGANCGTGPAELVHAMNGLARMARPGSVLVAKGNCGIPGYHDGQIRYDGTPELMARYARLACDVGARIIGACCGSTPEHLRAIADALAGYQAKDAPDVAAIEADLGPLSSATTRSAEATEQRQRRHRRRGARS